MSQENVDVAMRVTPCGTTVARARRAGINALTDREVFVLQRSLTGKC